MEEGNKNNLIIIIAVILIAAGAIFYYFFISSKGSEKKDGGAFIPTSELSLVGTVAEKKPDGISVVASDPTASSRKPELYVVKILPETDFIKIDKTQPDPSEEKITFNDLKISQSVFVRYIKDESGNLNAKKIYVVVSPPISASNTEKLEKYKK